MSSIKEEYEKIGVVVFLSVGRGVQWRFADQNVMMYDILCNNGLCVFFSCIV